jgi:D-sedoheptulose 7-phosphate isomerase
MSGFLDRLQENLQVMTSLRALEPELERAANCCVASLAAGGKILVCGNGGSAAEAMHLVGELVGRYKKDRRPLSAIALGVDPALSSCIGNDYRYQDIFARPLEAIGRREDVLIVFSTSGESPNILEALRKAAEIGIASIAFLGRDGGSARDLAAHSLIVRHQDTARIQEGHQFLMHSLMDFLEASVDCKTQILGC